MGTKKVVIAGSFSVYEEMKELTKELMDIGLSYGLPKHFKGYTKTAEIERLKNEVKRSEIKLNKGDYKKIGEVEKWFLIRSETLIL